MELLLCPGEAIRELSRGAALLLNRVSSWPSRKPTGILRVQAFTHENRKHSNHRLRRAVDAPEFRRNTVISQKRTATTEAASHDPLVASREPGRRCTGALRGSGKKARVKKGTKALPRRKRCHRKAQRPPKVTRPLLFGA